MAYGDIIRGAVFNPSDAADLIEGVLGDPVITYSTDLETFTGSVGYYEKVASRITVTKAANESVILLGMLSSSLSAGTAGITVVATRIFTGGAQVLTGAVSTGTSNGTGTTGLTDMLNITYIDTSTDAGSIVYGLAGYLPNAAYTLYLRTSTLIGFTVKREA